MNALIGTYFHVKYGKCCQPLSMLPINRSSLIVLEVLLVFENLSKRCHSPHSFSGNDLVWKQHLSCIWFLGCQQWIFIFHGSAPISGVNLNYLRRKHNAFGPRGKLLLNIIFNTFSLSKMFKISAVVRFWPNKYISFQSFCLFFRS